MFSFCWLVFSLDLKMVIINLSTWLLLASTIFSLSALTWRLIGGDGSSCSWMSSAGLAMGSRSFGTWRSEKNALSTRNSIWTRYPWKIITQSSKLSESTMEQNQLQIISKFWKTNKWTSLNSWGALRNLSSLCGKIRTDWAGFTSPSSSWSFTGSLEARTCW